jgi:prepilin-type N-terminal cleavage/methylation domain-containing protein
MSTQSTRARDGFTLIEVLAVIVILGILMIVLLPRLSGISERAKAKATGVWVWSVDAAAKDYEGRFGDFPPSQFQEKWGAAPNLTNLGGEALVVALWSTDWNGTQLREDMFSNTDNDETKRALTRFPTNSLQELRDEWGNPIAYYHRRDYGRTDNYVVTNTETGEIEELQVKAWMNPTTKTYFNSNTFQLISAGIDGLFGTEDDVTNFKRD